ncbi:hypothetical protein ONK27_28825, partial [Salmonella enterica subsp. enterica serovar Virginia]|nr:hypothetical protein [Salmonella enterica subsp. enterica serovar Virginia]
MLALLMQHHIDAEKKQEEDGVTLRVDVYLEYEAFAKKDWFDFYGYIDIPKTFDWGNGNDKGIWSDGS